MKFIKFIAIIAVVFGIFYFVSPQIPPAVSIKNLTPIRSYSQQLSLIVTINNYTPRAKTLYLTSAVPAGASSLYIDAAAPPQTTPLTSDKSLASVELPPFSHRDMTFTYDLASGVAGEQTVPGDSSALNVTTGSHTIALSIGGYSSNTEHFAVE